MSRKSNTFKLKFNEAGFEELRKQHALTDDLTDRANRVADAASNGGEVEGYMVTPLVLEDPRGAVSVMATGEAHNHNRKYHALLRNLDAGRGDA